MICITGPAPLIMQNHRYGTHPFGSCKKRLCQQLLKAKKRSDKTSLHAQEAHRHQARHHEGKKQQATAIEDHSGDCTHKIRY